MIIQNNNRKVKYSEDMDRHNRGDVMSHKNETQSPPQDHGDVERNKKRKQDVKKKESEKPQIHIDLVSKLTKSSAECVSVKSEKPDKMNLDQQIRLECMNFRKRVKDRYTFRLKKGPNKDEGINKSNCFMQNGVKNEIRPRFETFERRLRDTNHIKINEIKNAQKIISIHKAISAIKIKQTIKSKDKDLVEKKNESLQTETIKDVKKMTDKNRTPEIKTITSKQNARVSKAVTFVEQRKQPKPLDIKIPHKEVGIKTTNHSKLPIRHVTTVQTKGPTLTKRRQLSGKRKVIKRAQKASKSIESLPEVSIVPESVNQHTKPYYEAWVNKTLTATSKYSKKYKDCFDKTKVLQALKDMRMRKSSELMHTSSEQYAGRILVRQKNRKEEK